MEKKKKLDKQISKWHQMKNTFGGLFLNMIQNPFLEQIFTFDDKWNLYDNRQKTL